jgi:hypothetical protein
MLMLQMAAGGIGGASTAAVARALGGGRIDEADRLAQHALLVALLMARCVHGGHAAVPGAPCTPRWVAADRRSMPALAYSNVLFGGAAVIWRPTCWPPWCAAAGNMLLPAMIAAGHGPRAPRAVPAAGLRLGRLPGLRQSRARP